tara:strand:+ start:993 stop:3281 length:2289 start_codon:yes stop_codon:yes gene_type:complete
MTVQHEIKSQLAKLLATEDLIVEHKKVETAYFNVSSRVLTLPLWDKASSTVYDMLVGHEVGHALYTPDKDWWKEYEVPPSFVNIIEDVRIEKLMKRRYAGLAKSFYYGYQELNDDNFFSIDPDNIEEMGFADRINLHFKIGSYVDVPFLNDREREIVTAVNSTETFDDVLKAAHVLYEYCQELQDQKEKEELDISTNTDNIEFNDNLKGSSSESSDSTEEEELSEGNGESEEGGNAEQVEETSNQNAIDQNQPWDQQELDDAHAGMDSSNKSELEIDTVESFERAMKHLSNLATGQESVYIEIPEVDHTKLVIPNDYIHNEIEADWAIQQAEWDERNLKAGSPFNDFPLFESVDKDFTEFKRSAQKEVNYLVKEFECKKAASAYARATTSRTGVLNTSKLHTYKYNEDLFKKVTTLPEGKNHGLIFLLDWSGSMAHIMMDTVKQLTNLVWFCKKVNIPFDVYAFSNSYHISRYREEELGIIPPTTYRDDDNVLKIYDKKDGVFSIDQNFCLLNLLTSKVKGKKLDRQIENIYRIASTFAYRYHGGDSWSPLRTPHSYGLSGTPLNESLVAFNSIIPDFVKRTGVEKTQVVVLTDGEAHPLTYHKEVNRGWEENPYLGTRNVHDNCFVRDRKTGHTYPITSDYKSFTEVLLKHLRHRFPNSNFIGIRLLEGREHGYFIRRYVGAFGDAYDKAIKDWKKSKSCSVSEVGYHKYFAIASSAIGNETEFTVKVDATKADIKRAFAKTLKGKKMNKKILGEFIELVA